MLNSTRRDQKVTQSLDGRTAEPGDKELLARYESLIRTPQLHWTTHYHLKKLLGRGGQGSVFLTEQRGADKFTLPVAIKFFSPERYNDARDYSESMLRMAQVAARVAQIQHDNLLDIHNFLDRDRIRLIVMEWVDGYDLHRLLTRQMFERIRRQLSGKRFEYINRVVVTDGVQQPRLKPGVAVSIVRDCLSALAALHREGIIHGDVKPSNIMLRRTGMTKLIDIGSAYEIDDPPPQRTCTPTYAAPEVLDGAEITPLSDLASLGYVLIELLAGRPPFAGIVSQRQLLEAKRQLPQQLHELLPEEVTVNELLMRFCRGLIAPDPMLRFPDAETAELHKDGAAGFHRQLVLGNLASEYPNEIRLWLEELKEMDERDEQLYESPTEQL